MKIEKAELVDYLIDVIYKSHMEEIVANYEAQCPED